MALFLSELRIFWLKENNIPDTGQLQYFTWKGWNIMVQLLKKQNNNTVQMIIDILYEIAGSILIAIGTYNVALYAEFPMTGFSGIALILYRLFKAPMGITIIFLNIPVALLCGRRIGRTFLLKTIRCMIISSLMLDYLAPLFPAFSGDRMISALMTGTLCGLGYALIYIRGSSTGGLDFITLYVKSIVPHVKMGTITFTLDFLVIIASAIIFKDIESIVYGLIINLLLAVVVDKVILGMNSGNVALIVTTHGKEIADLIDQVSMRGSTILNARGGYNGSNKDVVMVAGTNKDLYQINKAVMQNYPDSFVIVLDSKEVHGEGFHVTKVAGE